MAILDRSLIAGLSTFAGLDASALDDILVNARASQVPKGTAVFEQGGEPHSFFLLVHGHLQVAKTTPDGQQVVVRYISPGEMFGIAVAMGLTRYPATATAVVDSVVLAWPSAAWAKLSSRYPQLSQGMLHTVGQRLQDAHTRVVEMSTELIEKRVASTLLRLAQQAGRKMEGGGIQIDFPISRQDIAQMTGTTLHTVSRILSAWEQRGLVESGRRRITVLKPHALVVLSRE